MRVTSFEALKQLNYSIVVAAISQWCCHLFARIKACGRHSEQIL